MGTTTRVRIGNLPRLLGGLLVLLVPTAPVLAAPVPLPPVIRVDERPFSETWDQMVARDRQKRADIEAGRLPRPSRLRPAPDEAYDIRKKPVIGPAFDNLPAAFRLEPEPTAHRGPGLASVDKRNALSFPGVTMTDEFNQFLSGSFPPDSTGAIGPTEYLELVNGMLARYDRQGALISSMDPDTFFQVTVGVYTYPRNGAFDPRLFYDRESGRWFACMLERGNEWDTGKYDQNNILLAVSRTSDPAGTWDKYVVPIAMGAVADVHFFNDYQTMGCDSNGLYFGWRVFYSTGGSGTIIAATRKAPLLGASPTLGGLYAQFTGDEFGGSPHPPHNTYPVGSSAPAWWFGTNGLGDSGIAARYCVWNAGGTPDFSGVQLVASPAYALPPDVPAQGSMTAIDSGDNRIIAAITKSGRVWMAHNVGVNSVGGSSNPDRCGVEWLVINTNHSPIDLEQSGRIYDDAATNPVSYLYPSIAPTGQGHAALSFSDSQGTRWVGAVGGKRLKWDPLGDIGGLTRYGTGQAAYNRLDDTGRNRWGDYSYSSIDPNDDMTIWTVQEYAETPASIWGTVISAIRFVAPEIDQADGGTVVRGSKGNVLLVGGKYFYEPGPSYPNHVTASFGTGPVIGMDVTKTQYLDTTGLAVTFDVATSAILSTRALRVTNPDGQSDLMTNVLRVVATTSITNGNLGGQRGQTVSHQATLIDSTINSPVAGQSLLLTVDGVDFGSAVTDASGVAKWTVKIPDVISDSPKTTVSFAGDTNYVASSKDGKLIINKNTTGLYLGPVPTVAAGAYAKLYCYLKRIIDGKVMAGRPVSFTYNGITAGGAVTDANGYAEVTYQVPANTPAGAVSVTVAFAGDATAFACSKSGSGTVNAALPVAMYNNSVSGGIGATVTVYAYLWRASDHLMLPNLPVEFRIDGKLVGTVKTDANGYAKLLYKIPAGTAAGIHPIMARFNGDATFSGISRTANLTVLAFYATSMSVASPSGAKGLPVKLYGYLWQSLDGAFLSGKTLSFSVDGSTVGTGVTNGTGYAYFFFTVPSTLAAGTHTVQATYSGDIQTLGSTASGKLTVADKDSLSWYLATVTGYRAGNVKLYGYVKSLTTGLMLSGKTVRFSVDGKAVGEATSTVEGYVGVPYHIAEDTPVGAHSITAQFAGDAGVNAGSATATLTVK